MSGDELKRIYKLSELDADQFAELLNQTLATRGRKTPFIRHHLYTQFSRGGKAVDADIEKAVVATPEIAKLQMLLQVQPQSEEDPSGLPGTTNELMEKALAMVNETLKMLKDSYSIIKDDNAFIKEDAKIFRSVVEEGVKQGAIVFKAPALKGR